MAEDATRRKITRMPVDRPVKTVVTSVEGQTGDTQRATEESLEREGQSEGHEGHAKIPSLVVPTGRGEAGAGLWHVR